MKKAVALAVVFAFFMFNVCYVSGVSAAEMVTQTIPSVEKAKEIASAAGGSYAEGATAPAVTGTQVAVPVIDKASGNILGYIVADKASLVAALNAAGYTEVASALAASAAGTAAGLTAGAGITTGTIVLGGALVAGAIALAVSSSGGGTTSNH